MDTNNNHKKLVPVILALVLVVGLFYWFSNEDTEMVGAVSLSVSADKPSYTVGESPKLTLRLTNDGASPVCLSETPLGNISFQSITRDGSPVETRTAPSSFLTSLTEMVKSKLTDVAPSAYIEIPMESSYDPGLGSETLYTTALDETSGTTTFYNIGKPGVYEISIAYDYVAGSSQKCAPVYEGQSTAATVSFTINP